MVASNTKVARANIDIAAPAASCWRALTDVTSLTSWHPERVEGDLAEGGVVTFAWDSLGQSIDLEVLELAAPHTLRLRNQPQNRPPQELSVSVRDHGAGCEVAVVHSGFREGPGGDDERAGTEAGWRASLAMLRLYVERYAGRSRVCTGAIGASGADLHAAYAVLTSQLGLPDCQAGELRAVAMGGGATFRGEVLVAAAPYYVLVDLPEIEGALALRTFSVGAAGAPESAILAAQLWTWGADSGVVEALRPSLEASLDRVIGSLGGPTAEA